MVGKVSKEKMLQDAVQAGQTGDNARARKLLLKLLRTDNQEPLYWLLMSTAVEAREERIYCLQNVLFLDPENSAAKHDLDLLGVEIPQANAPAFVPEEAEDWQTKEIAAPKLPQRRRKRKEETWPINWIAAGLGLGIIVIILGYYAAENHLLDALFRSPVNPTSSPPTFTTNTPQVQHTPTSQLGVVPLNPEDLLEATYTPTPLYVNTPHPENTAFEQGLASLLAEDWPAAIAIFRNYLSAFPESPDAAFYLGLAQLRSGDLLGARASFSQAISIQSQFAPGYLGRAQVGRELEGDPAAILTDINTAILLDRNYLDAFLERANFNLARGNLAEAESDILAAENIAPLSALVQFQKALIALAQENYSVALQASRRAYELDLTLLPNYLAKAQAEQAVGQHETSISTMQTYIRFRPTDATGWELLGLGYYFNDQKEAALESFNHALTLNSDLPQASYYRGLEELNAGRAQTALEYFRVAVAGEPEWFEAHIALARAQLGSGNPSGAFFEINSSSTLLETVAQRAMFFYWRATALEALDQMENALADWRSLLALPAGAIPPEWRQKAQERTQ
jgi:Tfp pilus assembly protein PilF